MATLFTETWTGSNGAAWPAQWTAGLTPTGGSATIQANAGRLGTGTAGGYAGSARVSRRQTGSYTDVDATTRFRFVAGESYPSIFARANTALDTGTGYALDWNTGGLTLYRFVSYARTTIGAATSFAFTVGTWYRLRFRVVGSTIQFKVWADNATEPAAWTQTVTDTTITAAGSFGFSVGTGSAATSSTVEFDDLSVTDGASVNAAPTANAGPDQTVEPWATVTLNGADADSDSDGTIATRSWSQVSGTAVTLTGTGAARTFEAPATNAGTTLVFRYSVTDNAGATTTDDVTVTVLPAAERILIAGTWVPARMKIV